SYLFDDRRSTRRGDRNLDHRHLLTTGRGVVWHRQSKAIEHKLAKHRALETVSHHQRTPVSVSRGGRAFQFGRAPAILQIVRTGEVRWFGPQRYRASDRR